MTPLRLSSHPRYTDGPRATEPLGVDLLSPSVLPLPYPSHFERPSRPTFSSVLQFFPKTTQSYPVCPSSVYSFSDRLSTPTFALTAQVSRSRTPTSPRPPGSTPKLLWQGPVNPRMDSLVNPSLGSYEREQ